MDRTESELNGAVPRTPAGSLLDPPDMLAEIVHIQREYVRDGDSKRMWELLLDAVLRTTGSSFGFIGEVDWSDRGIPSLDTRATRWVGEGSGSMAAHPDVGLLVSQVLADQQAVVVNLSRPVTSTQGRFAPISGFLGLPLSSVDRLVAVVGVTSPERAYDQEMVDTLEPLLSACASIVESIQATRARDRAIRSLHRTAAYLQAVINSTSHGVVVVGGAGIVESANRAAYQMLGYPEESLTGLPALDLIAPQAVTRARRLLGSVLRRGMTRPVNGVLVRARRVDGTQLPVELSLSGVEIDGDRKLVALFHDVSARVEAQQAAARAAEILDATPDLVAWGDVDGKLRYLNKGGRRMVGIDRDVSNLALDELAPDWAAERIRSEAIPTALDQGMWAGEAAWLRPGGGEVPVSLVVLAHGGEVDGFLAVVARDLTDRHEVERMKEDLISNVSHELRTPLTSILGYLELLTEGSFGPVAPEQVEALGVMQRNGDRLLGLIGQILTLSSVEQGGPDPGGEIDLCELVRSVAEELLTPGLGLTTEITVPEHPIWAAGAHGEMHTVISNLIANAIKFNRPEGRVGVRLQKEHGWARLEVSDTGIGIPKPDQERIFDRFYRGQGARDDEVQGAGLGLAIVNAVVARLRGRIAVESEEGSGTTIRVWLPVIPAEGR